MWERRVGEIEDGSCWDRKIKRAGDIHNISFLPELECLSIHSLSNSALVPAPLHPAQTHRTHLFTPLDTKDKQSEPLQLQPSFIAHLLLTSAQYPFVNRHPCAMPPSFPLLHPINLADKKLRQRERQSSVHALWVLRDLTLMLRLLAKDFQAKTKTSPRTTTENIDARPESPSEQAKDDPQHITQHPLPNPFRAHSDDTVKWTAVDADGSGRDLGDPLSLADWDRALSQT
ncbi:hypothetical protein BLNAU_15890 [Blattamonas nauphoetae]|uniref:Uncharacterized protein n=1 Tax=Blattamonas nauphoetae TaxID=2049346 RepID=A0ABQ9XE99_9EUKA|nr:hypothetical protein BLNAU_15890 [Blattamonas nauphoetae]